MNPSGDYKQKNLRPDFSAALERARVRYRRNRYDDGPAEKKMAWLITFTDVMGLMLTFFVMMFAMSAPQKNEFSELMAAMNSELNPFYGQSMSAGPEDSPNVRKINYNAALDLNYLNALMRVAIEKDEALQANVTVTPQGDRLFLSMPQDFLFGDGSAVLQQAAARPVFALAGTFSRIKNAVGLVGYADSTDSRSDAGVPYITGWGLSLARAAAVAAALDRAGYTDPVTIQGASAMKYDDPGGAVDENNRQDLSRRVDIVIMNHTGRANRVFSD